jgi:hypothetical protein
MAGADQCGSGSSWEGIADVISWSPNVQVLDGAQCSQVDLTGPGNLTPLRHILDVELIFLGAGDIGLSGEQM